MTPGKFIWSVYLIGVVAFFGILESMAFNHEGGLTLSRFIYNANQAWPLTGVFIGMIFGGLLVHFFWNWDPRLEKLQTRCLELEAEIERLKNDTRTAGGGAPPNLSIASRSGQSSAGFSNNPRSVG